MFSRDVAGIIADYASEHKLLSWIDESNITRVWLSGNPNAIDILKTNLEKIDWLELSCNPNAMDMIKANPNKINWKWLSKNPSIFEPNRDLILMRLVC